MDVLARALRGITAGLGVFLACLIVPPAPAQAATSALDVGDQAVVRVFLRGKGNVVEVRLWDRQTVQVESADFTTPIVDHSMVAFGTLRNPLSQQVPAQLYTTHDSNGATGIGQTLPPEEFPYQGFRPGMHDVVRVTANQGSARLVVTVPATTGVLDLRVGGGQTTINGYRGANLYVLQGQGRVVLMNATTTAFVQLNYGLFYAADGTFDRIRVRGIGAHDLFERCRSKQIEAGSITGTIAYDGGTFDPGLARFESLSGDIALGVTSPAQLMGRSDTGHVYTMFDQRNGASVDQHGDGDATASVGSGGPLVNALSTHGNVYLYDGTLASRRAVAPEWRPVHELFSARRLPPPAPPRARGMR
ncbi:MAG TPA: hypothetical protein VHT05_01125 [Candidatus Elarobacter sp.]|nr:hypothetical protein [Candidatus Elarobacter sp.]